MKERVLDLVFLVGVLFKGIDRLIELVGGILLLFTTPAHCTRGQYCSSPPTSSCTAP